MLKLINSYEYRGYQMDLLWSDVAYRYLVRVKDSKHDLVGWVPYADNDIEARYIAEDLIDDLIEEGKKDAE